MMKTDLFQLNRLKSSFTKTFKLDLDILVLKKVARDFL